MLLAPIWHIHTILSKALYFSCCVTKLVTSSFWLIWEEGAVYTSPPCAADPFPGSRAVAVLGVKGRVKALGLGNSGCTPSSVSPAAMVWARVPGVVPTSVLALRMQGWHDRQGSCPGEPHSVQGSTQITMQLQLWYVLEISNTGPENSHGRGSDLLSSEFRCLAVMKSSGEHLEAGGIQSSMWSQKQGRTRWTVQDEAHRRH